MRGKKTIAPSLSEADKQEYNQQQAQAAERELVFEKELTRRRSIADDIHKKITGKRLDPSRGWIDQLDVAIRAAEKRKTLSRENAQQYRKQVGWVD